MDNYPYTDAINLPSPIGLNLNGKYIKLEDLPESIRILIGNPKYVVLVRESMTTQTAGGGRTSGTMWYNNQVLGFTVEDAVRNKKIQDKTAIPDTISDPSKFNGLPSNVYNIILSNYTSKAGIRASFYKGTGMRISSKSDNTGTNIIEADVFTPSTFTTGNVAFSGVFIHGGVDEGYSSGCIIFSNTRKSNNSIVDNDKAVINLNKYLQEVKVIGKGKTQQLAIINLFDFPAPPPKVESSAVAVDSETNIPLQNVEIKLPLLPVSPIETGIEPPSTLITSSNFQSPPKRNLFNGR